MSDIWGRVKKIVAGTFIATAAKAVVLIKRPSEPKHDGPSA